MARSSTPKNDREKNDRFDPSTLDRTVIALPLLAEMRELTESGRQNEPINVIIDANLLFPGGRDKARETIQRRIKKMVRRTDALETEKNGISRQYVFARLRATEITRLVQLDLEDSEREPTPAGAEPPSPARAIYKVWLDHDVGRLTNKSISTVKADAARNAFGAFGDDIVWAVLDSGIDASHPHFKTHATLDLKAPLVHRDFTGSGAPPPKGISSVALQDPNGHGTHVAGIIAGECSSKPGTKILAKYKRFREDGEQDEQVDDSIREIRGMAPHAKLLSLKVLDDNGGGLASNLIVALEYIQQLNTNGRHLLVHGVNLSVGYDFKPEWFACGQSPLCVEVDRLVKSGVVVVVAAGNTGYGYNQTLAGARAAGLDITINDPGNADLAITVGSTHRDMPHVYGVSFFSSKGPTGDGRLKPDLVAPGEKIISCESVKTPRGRATARKASYVEDSGTSMAAPHVSGVIAAFLSIRKEFIGRPLQVKQIFLDSATDLNRAVYFQGRGLVDLMRAIQAV